MCLSGWWQQTAKSLIASFGKALVAIHPGFLLFFEVK